VRAAHGNAGRLTSRDWDAATYDRVSDPQFQWALEQLHRSAFRGDEVVLDAGCGTGRVTAELVRRVPEGRVYGVDVAPSMVAHARERLGEGATILCQDLVELRLPGAGRLRLLQRDLPLDRGPRRALRHPFPHAETTRAPDRSVRGSGKRRLVFERGRLRGQGGAICALLRRVALAGPFRYRTRHGCPAAQCGFHRRLLLACAAAGHAGRAQAVRADGVSRAPPRPTAGGAQSRVLRSRAGATGISGDPRLRAGST